MFKRLMRKYGYYTLAFLAILAVGLSAGLSGDKPSQNNNVPTPNVPTNVEQVTMLCPMKSPEVLKWYSDSELFYNSTLKQWESHKAVDLTSSVSADVYSALDGTITKCEYNYDNGYCITISHADGLVTNYCSLASVDGIKNGDKVTRGQKIGEASNTATRESLDGNHLHFSVLLNGQTVDPANYITFENK